MMKGGAEMTCKDIEILLDSLREDRLTQEQRAAIDAHLASCEICRFKIRVLDDLRGLDEEETLPEAFRAAWRQGIIAKEETYVKQFPRLTKFIALAASLLVLVGGIWLAGRERRQADSSAVYAGYDSPASRSKGAGLDMKSLEIPAAAPYAEDVAAEAEMSVCGMGEDKELKIIRTARMELSTRQFDADYEAILAGVASLGGRVQNTSLYNSQGSLRSVYLSLRIPAGQFDQAIASFKGVGRLVSFNESADDVSERYYDTASRLNTQRLKMERLQDLLAKAQSVEDLIAIESAITDTQLIIDQLTGSLQGMDSRVRDATLDLTLNELSPSETAQNQEETLSERIAGGMRAALEGFKLLMGDLIVFLAVALPYLIVLAVIVLLIRIVIKRRKKQ